MVSMLAEVELVIISNKCETWRFTKLPVSQGRDGILTAAFLSGHSRVATTKLPVKLDGLGILSFTFLTKAPVRINV